MCHTETETALRILQVQRLRRLIKTALTCSGVLFFLIGLDAIFLHDRLLAAPSYRFIYGWSAVTWWRWIAYGWGVVYLTAGVLLVLAGTKYPRRLRQAIGLGTLLTCWWTAGLLIEAVWSELSHRGAMPTLYPLFSWAAWAVQFLLMNQIPRVAPIAEDEIHLFDAVRPPTQDDVNRALHGDLDP
jgi:hypothetical protein